LSHVVRYYVDLTCSHCGSVNDRNRIRLYTSDLGQDPWDVEATVGKLLELDIRDFEDAFFTLRKPADSDTSLVALESFGCVVCQTVQFARLVFAHVDADHYRLDSASVVPLSDHTLDHAHFISRKLHDWSPNPGDNVERVEALLDRFLPRDER